MLILMTMTGQNGNTNLDKILLVDSSFGVDSLRGKKNLYQKIITFDFDSHMILSDHKIPHEISDRYLNISELREIQQKTFELSKWSKQKEISKLVEYEEINLGNLMYNDFMDFIAGFLKKFCEVVKIIQMHQNCEFVASDRLFDMAKILSNSVKLDNQKVIVPTHEFVKHSYRLGQQSISITLSKEKYLKLKNLSEFFLQKVFKFDKPKNNERYVLLVEFDPTKYKTLLLTQKAPYQNFLLYNRRWPTIWNLESFNVIRKSNCRAATFKTLTSNDLQTKIEEAKNSTKKSLQDLWSQSFFDTFFSFRGISFWIALKPFFEEKLEPKMKEVVQEIEIAKKLFEKYCFSTVLILSEIGPNEQIMLHLAKKNGIPVILMQHGLPYETNEASERNNLSGFFPNFSDNMIVWGDLTKKYLVNSGIEPSKLKPLGNPIYDDLFNIKNTKGETILLATSPPMKDLVYDNLVETNERYRDAIENICKIVTKLNRKLVIKLHPSLVDFDIELMAKKINNEIVIIKSGSIFPLIEDCKLLLTFDLSTTILEAQILKKPVVSIRLKDYGFGESEIFKTASCVTTSIQDLEQILNKILTDDSYKQEIIKSGNKFVNQYLANKESASKIILDFLKKF